MHNLSRLRKYAIKIFLKDNTEHIKCSLCGSTLEILVQDSLITRREYDGTILDIHQCK